MSKDFIITCIFLSVCKFSFSTIHKETQVFIAEENQIYSQTGVRQLLLQSNIVEIDQIHSIGYNLWENAFKMENFAKGKLIQILFLHSLHFQSELFHCVCQLIQNEESYFIKCIDGLKVSSLNIERLKTAKAFLLPLNLNKEEYCDQLFQDTQNNVILFCQSNLQFKVFKIDLLNIKIITLKSSNELSVDVCKKIFYNYGNHLILTFVNCENWVIYDLINDQLEILLDKSKLINTNYQFENQVNDVLHCQNYLYLLILNYYYIYEIKNQELQFFEKVQTNNPIISLIFENCQVTAVLTEGNISKPIIFNLEQKEITLQQGKFSQVFLTPEYLILKNKNKLLIALSAQFNQTYEILSQNIQLVRHYPNSLMQVYLPDLFYQIDISLNITYFYEFKKIKRTIQLKQNFLLVFLSFNFFKNQSNYEILEYQIAYKNLKYYQTSEQGSIETVELKNECQFEDYFFLNKQIELFPEQINNKMIIKKSLSIELTSIQDEIDYYKLYPNLQQYNIKEILLHQSIFEEGKLNKIVFITNDDELIALNMINNEIQYQKNISGKTIHQFESFTAIVDHSSNEINILLPSNQKFEQLRYQLKSNIQHVNKYKQFLTFLLQSKEILIFDMIKLQSIQLDTLLKQQGFPLFFFQKATYQIVQYKNFIAIKEEEVNKLFPFENVQIIEVDFQRIITRIKAIDIVKNLLKIYDFDKTNILLKYEYFLEKSQIAYPLKYSLKSTLLSVACILNNSKVIQVFYFDNYVKLISVKRTVNYYFYYQNGKLIYFNLQNQLVQYDILQFNISFQNIHHQQNHLSLDKFMISTIYKKNNQLISIKRNFTVQVINRCYKIFNRTNTTIIKKEDDKINIRAIFQGPINKLTINNESQIKVSGPLIYLKNITYCKSQEKNSICMKQLQVENKNNLHYFQIECIQDKASKIILELCKLKILNQWTSLRQYIAMVEMKLIIIIIREMNEAYMHIFYFQEEKQLLVELVFMKVKEKYKDLEQQILEKQLKRIGNLLVTNLQKDNAYQQTFFIHINKTEIKSFSFDSSFYDVCFIKNSSEWYLMLRMYNVNKQQQNYYSVDILTLEDNQMIFLYNFQLGVDFFNYLKNSLYFAMEENFQFDALQTNFCQKVKDQITFILFVTNSGFSGGTQFSFNLNTKQLSYEIIKVFRNPRQDISYSISHIDESLLVLKNSKTNEIYFYNLLENDLSLDYFGYQNNLNLNFYKLNTTHYIFRLFDCDCFSIGIVGYRYNLSETKQESFIIAQNNISMAKIQILMENNSSLIDSYLKWMEILTISMLLFCFLYLLRRCYLKYKKLKKEKKSLNQDNL